MASVTGEDIRTAELLWQNKRLRTHPRSGTIQDKSICQVSFTIFPCGSLWKVKGLEKGLRRWSHDRFPPFCPAGPRENGSHTHIASQVRAAILPDLSSFSLQYQRYLRGDDRCWGVIGKPGTQVKLKPDLILTSSKANLSVHLREASGT